MAASIGSGPEIAVGSAFNNVGWRIGPNITRLANGNLLVAWEGHSSYLSSHGIHGRLYDSDGNPLGAAFDIDSTPRVTNYWADAAPLPGGGFFVAWQSLGFPTDFIRGRVFGADGSPIAGDFVVSTTPSSTPENLGPSVTALADGKVLVAWSSWEEEPNKLRARLFDAGGTALGPDFVVNTTSVDEVRYAYLHRLVRSDAVSLNDGRFLITWASPDTGDGSASCIRGRFFNSNGGPVGNDFIINTTTLGVQSAPEVAALPDGRFIVTWSNEVDDGIPAFTGEIRGRLFDANGSAVGGDFVISEGLAAYYLGSYLANVYEIVGLADGRFAVAWMAKRSQGQGFEVHGRILNGDGSPDGNEFRIGTEPIGAGFNDSGPDLTALPDGRFAVTWYADRNQAIRSDDLTRLQIFDPKLFVGSRLADVWRGGNLEDQISGLDGTDVLSGGDGDDILAGDVGSDQLFGDGGDDTLGGGTGNDVLDGGQGADAMSGGQSDDTYYVDDAGDQVFETAGSGIDTVLARADWILTANQEVEVLRVDAGFGGLMLTGNGLRNRVEGADGNDRLAGGAGLDKLYGAAGDDALLVSQADLVAKEIYDGGVGTDTLDGSAATALVDLSRVTLLSLERIVGFAAGVRLTSAQLAAFDHIDTGPIFLLGGGTIDLSGATVLTDTLTLADKATNLTLAATVPHTVNGGVQSDAITLVGLAGGTLIGGNGNDRLSGGDGDDTLSGGGNDDRLAGGAGDDILIGVRGQDILTGGTGADRFTFQSASNTLVGIGDVIQDFEQGIDKIDLSAMGTFNLLAERGAAFTGSAHELRFYANGKGTVTFIEGDLDGDAHRDFQMRLVGGFTLTQGDFA